MSQQDLSPAVIAATLVPEKNRLNTLPHFFGCHMGAVENSIFHAMRMLCADYNGSYWDYYELSNDAFFMAPVAAEKWNIECTGNYFRGEMSAQAAGIVATLFGLSRVANEFQEDSLIECYHALRDFALDHPESALIMAAID